MQLNELYPFWGDIHQELIDAIESLTEPQILMRPAPPLPSVAEIVLEFVTEARFFVGRLIGGNEYEVPRRADYGTSRALVELLEATRELEELIMEPFSREGLRAVRTVPADPKENRPETNMTVAWLIWHAMEREIYHYGRIRQRIQDGARGAWNGHLN
ncbi:hypothetical protein CCAX7_49370 [Capsulimonas corticalis]|uniref:Uncharacterized protein n=1 Tax=Capsulimonas corticalis TaxID=2219043 RepID=A0A402CQ36_9BACT|nr:DinB family protein [Capsulimonas corticalis]BDI32886.1 hypothetical protein CCAX7_49370 [Capsulimonas corticalis]